MNITKELKALKETLSTFSIYTPQFELNVADMKEESKKIVEDLKLKMGNYLKPVDNRFSLENF